MKFNINSFAFLFILGLISCQPFVEDKSDLGPVPTPSFEVASAGTPNDFTLSNTTAGAFITQWDLGSLGKFEGEVVVVNFPFKGDYEVNMTTFNRGGHASTSQMITVTQDDPSACKGNLKLLTGCDEKVWKLANEPNAIHIGPNLNDTWWGNSSGDINDRSCHFNDEYIFRSSGEFEYNNNGDFWADSDDQGNIFPADLGLSVGCHQSSEWPAAYQSWDSGIHEFTVTNSALSVIGEGAWIGLYKIGTAGEVGTPQTSVTYSILELTENRMVIYADYGWGVWRLTLISE